MNKQMIEEEVYHYSLDYRSNRYWMKTLMYLRMRKGERKISTDLARTEASDDRVAFSEQNNEEIR